MSKDKKKLETDLEKYRDPSGLSLKKINFGLWLSEKRKDINKIIIIFLVLISVFFFSYSIYSYIVYFINGSPEIDNHSSIVTTPKNQVSDLVISNPLTFKNNNDYDLAATLKNPNDRFIAYFNYCFIVDEVEITCDDSFILPNDEKTLLALSKIIPSESSTANLTISRVSWQRIDNRKIPNWNDYVSDRLNISINNIKVSSSGSNSSGQKFNYLEFSIINNGAYSYYQLPLNINFYRGDQVVGVNRHIINDFQAGEKRVVRLSWVTSLTNITKTEISPDINILDPEVYFKYTGSNK